MSPESEKYQPSEEEVAKAEGMLTPEERFQSAHKISKAELEHDMESKYTTPAGNHLSNLTKYNWPNPAEHKYISGIRDADGVRVGWLSVIAGPNLTASVSVLSPKYEEVSTFQHEWDRDDQDRSIHDISPFVDDAITQYRSAHLSND